MKVWRLMAYHEHERRDPMIAKMIEIGAVCLGWGMIGTLSELNEADEASIRAAIGEEYETATANRQNGACSLRRMFCEVGRGHYVLVRGEGKHAILEVTGSYSYVEDDLDLGDGRPAVDDYSHRLPARVAPEAVAIDILSTYVCRTRPGVFVRHALIPMEPREQPSGRERGQTSRPPSRPRA